MVIRGNMQVPKTSVRIDSDNDETGVLVNTVDGDGDTVKASFVRDPYHFKPQPYRYKTKRSDEMSNVQTYTSGFSGNNTRTDQLGGKLLMMKSLPIQKPAHKSKLVTREAVEFEKTDEECKDLHVAQRSDDFKVNATLLPSPKYPPRRKISAVRVFPEFCGRDAPRPTKEQYIKMGLGHLHEEMLAKDSEAARSEEHEVSTMPNFEKKKSVYRGDKITARGDTVNAYHFKPQPYCYKTKRSDEMSNVQTYSSGFSGNNTRTDQLGGKLLMMKSLPIQKPAHRNSKLVIRDAVEFEKADEECEDLHVAQRSDDFKVNVAPLVRHSSMSRGSNCYSYDPRSKVRETLRYFQVVRRKLLQENEAASKKGQPGLRRVDLAAANIVKSMGKNVNVGESIIGKVPGVEVGDEFHYRVELAMVGLHRPIEAGIDYVRKGTKILATSVVASGAYANELGESELTYMGAGGNIAAGCKKKLEPEDQKLERGNLAMKNSADMKNSVRVVRGFKETETSRIIYMYDGLYKVDEYWQEEGPHGKQVFKFMLRRCSDQPVPAWKEVNEVRKNKFRKNMCAGDISLKKESLPVCVINNIDGKKPPKFEYITSMRKHIWYNPLQLKGCGCKDRCVDSDKCSCAGKNGSVFPYNVDGCIVEVKQLVYECGRACKCPDSCRNRVSQHGPKFQLEIFKTESKGWGVRSLNSIPSGRFICEYLGEILSDKEAELKIGRDEYLFNIGQNYKDLNLHDGPSDDYGDCGGFTIDAEECGNVGRFINHSCSPNLYAQSVLYDHEDKRRPHIMFFAVENIPPLTELTYHYNYKIGQVRDSDGNILKKTCHCGSTECVGRIY